MTESKPQFTTETQSTQRSAIWNSELLRNAFLVGTVFLAACQQVQKPDRAASKSEQDEVMPQRLPVHHLTPSQTADAFISALQRGDIDAAREVLAIDPTLPPEAHHEITDKLQGMAHNASRGWRMTAVAEQIDGDCAVTIMHDRNPTTQQPRFIDLDPMFMILQNDKWHILLGNPMRPTKIFALNSTQQTRIRELHKWYEAQQPELQAKLRSEGHLEN